LFKFSEGPNVIAGTDDITFTLCSITSHVLPNLNVTPGHYAALRTY